MTKFKRIVLKNGTYHIIPSKKLRYLDYILERENSIKINESLTVMRDEIDRIEDHFDEPIITKGPIIINEPIPFPSPRLEPTTI